MKFADSVKQTASLTSTATITLGAAATGFRTLAQAITDTAGKLEQVAVGDIICMRVEDVADASKWEIRLFTITAPGALTGQSIVSSSAAGAAVTFDGSVTVLCTVPSSHLARTSVDSYPSFSQSVPLTQPGTAWMPQYAVTGALAFTPAAGAVKGAFASIPFIHDGASAITFPGFTQHGSSIDFVSGKDMPWTAVCWYDGVRYWYQLSQAANPIAIDTTAPTISSASVANGTPTIVTLTASEALDPNYTPAATAFTVGGHSVSGVAVAGSAVNLTVSAAFANGEAARTVNYTQPGSNGLRDQAGNLLASFSSALAITNNVQPADVTPPTFASAQVANASPSIILLTMSETLANSVPPASAFSVSGGKTVSSVSISGAVVSLTCSAAYANGETITATYTAPASSPRLQDAAGNATASFGPVGVTNNVAVAAAAGVPVFGSLANVTRTGDTYTGAGGSAFSAASAMCTTKFQNGVDGSIDVKVVAKRPGTAYPEFILGVTSSATAVAYQSLPYAIYAPTFSGKYKVINGGSVASATTDVSIADTDIMRLERVGTATPTPTINLRVSSNNGGSWTTIYSWATGVPTTALSIEMLFNDQFTVSPVASSGLA